MHITDQQSQLVLLKGGVSVTLKLEKHFSSQAIVGEQLTVERGVNGLMNLSNGFTSGERREGLHFEIADFHGGIKFLEVIIGN